MNQDNWSKTSRRVIYMSEVGSRLFGTDDDKSDVDLRGVWVGRPVEPLSSLQVQPGRDTKIEGLVRFMQLLLAGDNNSLEVLYGNPVVTSGYMAPILANRDMFVSTTWMKGVHKFAVLAGHRSKNTAYLAHALRVVSAARHVVETGVFEPNVVKRGWTPEGIDLYRQIKRGFCVDPEVIAQVERRVTEMVRDLDDTGLPTPTLHQVNDLVHDVLTTYWRDHSWNF